MPRKAWVSPEVHDTLLKLAQQMAPDEACGIITPALEVIRLPNGSSTPHNEFFLAKEDLVEPVAAYIEQSGIDPLLVEPEHFIVWHSHPGGLIGPSSRDMEQPHLFRRLVITLPGGELTYY